MAVATVRGAKRKCQNEDCALPFYDLNREAFECPNCGTSFDFELHARVLELANGYQPKRKPRELTIVAPPTTDPEAWDGDEEDVAADGDDDLATAAVSPDQPLLDADNDSDEHIDDIAPSRPGGGDSE